MRKTLRWNLLLSLCIVALPGLFLLVSAFLSPDPVPWPLTVAAIVLLLTMLGYGTGHWAYVLVAALVFAATFVLFSKVPFLSSLALLAFVGPFWVVYRRRRRKRARQWTWFLEMSRQRGLRCFVVGFAKPNGAQTLVNGHDLFAATDSSRNTNVWGPVSAGTTIAMDEGRRVLGAVPTAYSVDAAAVTRYRWQWV